MYSQMVLIVCEQPRAEVFKERLLEDPSIIIETAYTEDDMFEKIDTLCPDLIILADELDNTNGFKLCEKIRSMFFLVRPVIVMASSYRTEDSSNSIKALMAGSDDFITSQMMETEFTIRIHAHLRRHFEALCIPSTKLPGQYLFYNNLKRRINQENPWSLLFINLNDFKPYSEIYGDLAANQLVKTLVAILKSSLLLEDFIGQLSTEEFAILTEPIKAEMMADHICKTFDKIVPRFYAPIEAERGFSIVTDEQKASRKVALVSLSIGIVSNTYRHFDNYKTALSIAGGLRDLAKYQIASGWLVDRPLLSGDEYYEKNKIKPCILVVESDAALAYLLKTTLEMEGYYAEAYSNRNEAIDFISENHPALVLVDTTEAGSDGWSICDYLKDKKTGYKTKIVMVTALHDREKAFSYGADLYIHKPYELVALHKWINKLINDYYTYA